MKAKISIITFLIYLSSFQKSEAQDTLIFNNNYKYKIGAKVISEKSGFDIDSESNHVFSGGFQLIRVIKNSHFSYETGIYYHQNSADIELFVYQPNFYQISVPHYYHNLRLPLNLRYDTKILYCAAGTYFNYLLGQTSANEDLDSNMNLIDRKINIGVNLNIGLEKQINKTINLFVESRYSTDITSAYKKLARHFSYTNFGFAIGLNYKLF